MRRISKRVREEAALICAIAASTPREYERHNVSSSSIYVDLGGDIWHPEEAFALSTAVRRAAVGGSLSPTARTQETDAEAEALLRCGWSPP